MDKEEKEKEKLLKNELDNLQCNPKFIKVETLIKREAKLIEIFKKFKNKLTGPKTGLFIHPKEYNFQSSEYKDYFIYENTFPLKDKKGFSFIYDCFNFMCYREDNLKSKDNKEIYLKKINDIFSLLNEKGTLVILLDQFNLEFFFSNLILL